MQAVDAALIKLMYLTAGLVVNDPARFTYDDLSSCQPQSSGARESGKWTKMLWSDAMVSCYTAVIALSKEVDQPDSYQSSFKHLSVFAIARHLVVYSALYEIKEKKRTSAIP